MRKILALVPVWSLMVGCVVYGSDDDCCDAPHPPPPPPPAPVNHLPYVYDAQAGVYWDGHYHDDIWYFDATVGDPDGLYDVAEVWADIYDDWTGEYVDTFELYPTADPNVWFSDWLGSSTWLDPWYGYYGVDFVVYDVHGESGYATVGAVCY